MKTTPSNLLNLVAATSACDSNRHQGGHGKLEAKYHNRNTKDMRHEGASGDTPPQLLHIVGMSGFATSFVNPSDSAESLNSGQLRPTGGFNVLG